MQNLHLHPTAVERRPCVAVGPGAGAAPAPNLGESAGSQGSTAVAGATNGQSALLPSG
jgi:hypothetical protein